MFFQARPKSENIYNIKIICPAGAAQILFLVIKEKISEF